MRTLHLFAGLGGSHLAFGNILGFPSVGSVEYNEYCQEILAANLPGEDIHGDVRTFSGRGVDAQLMCMGFPCTDLSDAGEGKGILEGSESKLFFEGMRIATEANVPLIFVENVHGLLTNLKGKSFELLLQEMQKRGYGNVRWLVNRASDVGAPQRRERVWLIAQYTGKVGRTDWTRPSEWPDCGMMREGEIIAVEKEPVPRDRFQRYWPTPDASQIVKITPLANQEGIWKAIYAEESRTWIPKLKGQPAPNPKWVECLMGWPMGYTYGAVDSLENWPAAEGKWPMGRGVEQHDWEPMRLETGKDERRGKAVSGLGNAWVPQQAVAAWKELNRPARMSRVQINLL